MFLRKLISPFICIILISLVASCRPSSTQPVSKTNATKKDQVIEKMTTVHHQTPHSGHLHGVMAIKPMDHLEHRVQHN